MDYFRFTYGRFVEVSRNGSSMSEAYPVYSGAQFGLRENLIYAHGMVPVER